MAYKITIKKGNSINEDTDFITNASNTKLLSGSGASIAFKRHYNKNLQNKMNMCLHTIPRSELNHANIVITFSCADNSMLYTLP